MRCDSLSHVLFEVRLGLETRVVNGKVIRVKLTPELDFFQQICVLIPSDLLFSVNIFYPPFLFLRVWLSRSDPSSCLLQRYHDIDQMISRVLLWYEEKIPLQTETNAKEINLLTEMKFLFLSLQAKNNTFLTSSMTKHGYSSNQFCCCPHCFCSGGSCWDSCWETLFFCCLFSFLLYLPKSEPIDSSFQLQDRYEGPYGAGGARKFYCSVPCCEEKDGNRTGNSSTESCCSNCHCDGCTRCCADCCWYCTPSDSPSHHHHRLHHHHHSDYCCRECCVSSGFLDTCGDCCKNCLHGISSLIRLSIEGAAKCCHHLSDCLASCRHCYCPSADCPSPSSPDCCDCNCVSGCSCDCCKAEFLSCISAICGAIGAVISLIFDATTDTNQQDDSGDNGSDSSNSTNISDVLALRRLSAARTETSAEYTPSIVFMTLALIIFLPRILCNLSYVFLNLSQGISVNHSLKLLTLMILLGAPLAILLAALGGASRWTYVSLLLLFMHSFYALYAFQRKRVDPRLTDLSFLSCTEWREYQLQQDAAYLPVIVSTLLRFQELFRAETKKLKALSSFFVVAKVLWPTLDKAIFRWTARDDIQRSHRLDSASLRSRYPDPGQELGQERGLPVATLVVGEDLDDRVEVKEGARGETISSEDRL